jgi:hypothetical protein
VAAFVVGAALVGHAVVGDRRVVGLAEVADRPGWHALTEPPIPPRTGALVATGEEVLLVAGSRVTGGHRWGAEVYRDAAAFDIASGRWRLLPRLPTDPLYGPEAVLIEGQVIVVGVACRRFDLEAEACTPGNYQAAAYDLSSQAWRRVSLPPELEAEGADTRISVDALGALGAQAVFAVADATGAHHLVAYAPREGGWRPLPAPQAATRDACAAGSAIVSLSYRFEADGVLTDVDPSIASQPGETVLRSSYSGYAQPVVSRLDTSATAWSPPLSTSGQAPGAASRYDLVCAAHTAIVTATDLGNVAFTAFDIATSTPTEVPAPPVPVELPIANRVFTGNEVLFWSASAATGMALRPADLTWRPMPAGPDIGDVSAVADGNLFVYVGDRLWGDHPRFFVYLPADDATMAEEPFPINRRGDAPPDAG